MILSRTIVAAAISLITAILMIFGVTVSVVDQEILINAGVIIASAIAAIYFRSIAKTNLQTGAPLVPAKAADPLPVVTIKD